MQIWRLLISINGRQVKTPKTYDKCIVVSPPMSDCHTFASYFSGFSNVYYFACVWPTALKLGSVTNLDTLFLVIGFLGLMKFNLC